MNQNVFPIGWRWLNPAWLVRAWCEYRHRHRVRVLWLEAYGNLCRDDMEPGMRQHWRGVLAECDAEMDRWSETTA